MAFPKVKCFGVYSGFKILFINSIQKTDRYIMIVLIHGTMMSVRPSI